MTSWDILILAVLGGVLPALVWLLFWLIEDRDHPEPGMRISGTFLLGMFAVVLVLPFQKIVQYLIPDMLTLSVILWALLEEVFKFGAGYIGGLSAKDDNEPVDALIYMITAALGFVALENTLFLLGPIMHGNWLDGLLTGNLRFVGASLLHVVSSGIIGMSLSFTYHKNKLKRRAAVLVSFLCAALFHIIFNLLIMKFGTNGTGFAFIGVWSGVIFLLWAFERAKSIV